MDEGDSRAIWGVDFSAAKSDAGRKTWIADYRAENGDLEVQNLSSAREHLDVLDTNKRERVLEKLVEAIGDLDGGVVAMDFPFSLPHEFFESNDWKTFVEGTPNDWGTLDGVSDPESLYEAVKKRATESDDPVRRATDDEHGGQDPAGFWIKTPTYYGISSVLGPLIENHDVAIPPMHDGENPSTTVIETYPAAVFGDLGAKRQGYKADDRAGVARRRDNLEILKDADIGLEEADADCAIGTDNALDALAAAYAAWKTERREPDWFESRNNVDGRIYTGENEQ